MDPLSIIGAISAIASLAGAGAKLSIFLFEVSSQIGSAGDEVRDLGIEISLFCAVLKQLQQVLSDAKSRRSSVTAVDTTQQIIARCKVIFDNIDIIVKSLHVDTSKAGQINLDIKARIKWTLKKNKVQTYRATLESCKITLTLMVNTLTYANVISSRRYSDEKTELEDAEEEAIAQSLASAQLRANERLASIELEDDRNHEEAPLSGAPPAYQHHHFTRAAPAATTVAGSTQPLRAPSASKPDFAPFPGTLPENRSTSTAEGEGDEEAIPAAATAPAERLESTVSFELPIQRPPERASVWLNRLTLDEISMTRASSRRGSTLSIDSTTRHRQVELLLSRWTDQGDHWASLQQHQQAAQANRPHETPTTLGDFAGLKKPLVNSFYRIDSVPISPGSKPATEPKYGFFSFEDPEDVPLKPVPEDAKEV